ncbi:MAG: metallopeptidase family protein [Desulfobacteraceae bacterium]|nr:MAG: metallopeptidase family protein [Desulfobacteraceae bacterium]
MNVSRKEFDRIVMRAIRRIPEEIRNHLDNLLISVQKRPSPELLEEMGIPADETLFGVFQGTPLVERSVMDRPLFPDTIFLFQEPLLEACANVEELEKEIEITVVHELAHFLGFSEEDLAELGYS